MKTCFRCGIPKENTKFNKKLTEKDGLNAVCRECRNLERRNNYRENKEQISSYLKEWRKNNRFNPISLESKERAKKYRKVYRQKLEVKLRNNLSKIASRAIKHKNRKRSRELLGCSYLEFRNFIEKQFDDKMTWKNYGQWHLDHVKPIASFNLLKQEEISKCFHYTNYQPLWAEENMRKHTKILPRKVKVLDI